MRLFLVLMYILTLIIITIFAYFSYRRKSALSKRVGRILIATFFITLGYSVNLCTDNYTIVSIGYSIKLIGIDFMLLLSLYYLYDFLKYKETYKTFVLHFLRIAVHIDSIVLLMNPFREIVLTYKKYTYCEFGIYIYTPFAWYYFHLALCYVMVIIACILLIVKCARIPKVYWYRYIDLLAIIIVTVLANALFVLTKYKFDLSTFFYGFIATNVYWVTFLKIPDTLLASVHRTMLSCIEVPMILFDYEDIYVECNENLYELFPNIYLDRNSMTLHQFIEQTGLEPMEDNQNKTFRCDFNIHDAIRHYECKYMYLESKSLKKKGTLITFHDITSLLQAYEKEQNALRANNAKTMFLANMSHEIRTPMNTILGMDEMILRESTEPQIREYAAAIETSGQTLLSLINDVLDFSKIESGKVEIVPVKYQLSSLLNDVITIVKPRANAKKLDFKVHVDSKIPNELMGDEVRIRQILLNLIGNAIKYTDVGKVKLRVEYDETIGRMPGEKRIWLFITVSDTGRGIRPEDINKLFHSFQRVDIKNNRTIEGTGLGLAITKNLIDLMHGRINVESEYLRGSKFKVAIPQEVISEQPMGDLQMRLHDTAENRTYGGNFIAPDARILLVDDNEINLMVEEKLMKQTKVKVDTATSGIIAIELLKKHNYDIVLLDHMMPVMDGVETLKQMRQMNLAQGVPIIALTANAVSGARDMYLEYGFHDYLSKPIDGHSLEKILQKWLPSELIHTV